MHLQVSLRLNAWALTQGSYQTGRHRQLPLPEWAMGPLCFQLQTTSGVAQLAHYSILPAQWTMSGISCKSPTSSLAQKLTETQFASQAPILLQHCVFPQFFGVTFDSQDICA